MNYFRAIIDNTCAGNGGIKKKKKHVIYLVKSNLRIRNWIYMIIINNNILHIQNFANYNPYNIFFDNNK